MTFYIFWTPLRHEGTLEVVDMDPYLSKRAWFVFKFCEGKEVVDINGNSHGDTHVLVFRQTKSDLRNAHEWLTVNGAVKEGPKGSINVGYYNRLSKDKALLSMLT